LIKSPRCDLFLRRGHRTPSSAASNTATIISDLWATSRPWICQTGFVSLPLSSLRLKTAHTLLGCNSITAWGSNRNYNALGPSLGLRYNEIRTAIPRWRRSGQFIDGQPRFPDDFWKSLCPSLIKDKLVGEMLWWAVCPECGQIFGHRIGVLVLWSFGRTCSSRLSSAAQRAPKSQASLLFRGHRSAARSFL